MKFGAIQLICALFLGKLILLSNILAQERQINYMTQSGHVSNQENNGTCYAHSAEQLLRFYYRERYPKGFVAQEMALRYGETAGRHKELSLKYGPPIAGNSGGNVHVTIHSSYGPNEWRGLCERTVEGGRYRDYYDFYHYIESFLPEQFYLIEDVLKNGYGNKEYTRDRLEDFHFSLSHFFRTVIISTPQFDQWCVSSLGYSPEDCEKVRGFVNLKLSELNIFKDSDDIKTFTKNFLGYIRKTRSDLSHYYSQNPKLFRPDRSEAYDPQIVMIITDLMRKFFNTICLPFKKPQPKYKTVVELNKYSRGTTYTDRSWEKLSTDFIENFLSKGKLVGLGTKLSGVLVPTSNFPVGDIDAHAVTIVGAKTFLGNRYYLVKNSWGSRWVPKQKGVRVKGVLNPNFNPNKDENWYDNPRYIGGYFWMSKDLFSKYTFSVTAISDKEWAYERGSRSRINQVSENEDFPNVDSSLDSKSTYEKHDSIMKKYDSYDLEGDVSNKSEEY